jgi:dolichol kinase
VATTSGALSFRRELARKSLHILTVVAPLAYTGGLPRRTLAALVAAACLVVVSVEVMRLRHDAARAAFHRAVGQLLRAHEQERWAGATWLLLAFLGAVLFTPRNVAITAMWAVSAGDAAAALVGRGLGRHHLTRSPKTVAGSAACFAVTFLGALYLAQLTPGAGLVAATAATIAEWPRRPIDDNLRIVLAVSLGLLAWHALFS